MSDVLQNKAVADRPSGFRLPALHALMWSVRREMWENRSIVVAPICVALLILLGLSIGAAHLAPMSERFGAFDPDVQQAWIRHVLMPIQAIILGLGGLVAFFYCLDALFNERRDRSILFWKSMPVSDLETVLAKLAIPLLVIPVVAFVVICCTQLIVLIVATLILSTHGVSLGGIWSNLSLVQLWVTLIWGELVIDLWYLPVYGWLFLVSAWAPRLPFFWAVLPPVGAMIIEYFGFGTIYVASIVWDRIFAGAYLHGFQHGLDIVDTSDAWHRSVSSVPDPAGFFATPSLWIGLVVALAMVAAAVLIRRFREAI